MLCLNVLNAFTIYEKESGFVVIGKGEIFNNEISPAIAGIDKGRADKS